MRLWVFDKLMALRARVSLFLLIDNLQHHTAAFYEFLGFDLLAIGRICLETLVFCLGDMAVEES